MCFFCGERVDEQDEQTWQFVLFFSEREALRADGRSTAFWSHRTCFEVVVHPSVASSLTDPAAQQ
jgi:hypothetical protein